MEKEERGISGKIEEGLLGSPNHVVFNGSDADVFPLLEGGGSPPP